MARPRREHDAIDDLATTMPFVLGKFLRRLRNEWLEVNDELSMSQVNALSLIEQGGATTVSELAAAEHVRPQSMAATVTSLHDLGFIERVADDADRRRVRLRVTTAGRKAVVSQRGSHREWLAGEIRTRLSRREQQVLDEAIALLDRLGS